MSDGHAYAAHTVPGKIATASGGAPSRAMESKRVQRDGGRGAAAKRAKVAVASSDDYEVSLNGERYVDVDKLFKSATLAAYFNKLYKRSVARLIQDARLTVVVVAKKHVVQGVLIAKTSYSPKADVRLVLLDDAVRVLIERASGSSLPIAPPVIKDPDLTFFVDHNGTRHVVEMRGERTMELILFKAKDVGRVFASDNFVTTLQDPRGAYQTTVDYVWLTLPIPGTSQDLQCTDSALPRSCDRTDYDHHSDLTNLSSRQGTKPTKKPYQLSRELFLTFAGLMHALHSTRSPLANEFRTWIYTQVFAIAYGTEEQKKAMVNELCRVDKRFLEAFMKLVPNDIACLYLLDTNKRDKGKRVLKFGRSSNVKDRFYKHSYTFGDDCLLDTIVFVPGDMLSEAEMWLSRMVSDSFRYESGNAREMLLLDGGEYKTVRACMQTIADKYNGSLAVHSLILDGEVKDVKTEMREQQLRYELRINDLERMIEVMDERAQAQVSQEQLRIAVLEQQLDASKQQLEATKLQLEQQNETAQLRLQLQELRHSALLQEKDRRIQELEARIDEAAP